MELKKYQSKVIDELRSFLETLNVTRSTKIAYETYWRSKGLKFGLDGLKPYKDTITHTPHVCFKVPTGGGKTFLACSSIKPIFDAMPFTKTKAVVWLVPSTGILEQTIKTLNNVYHPYRQKIDVDFNRRVEIYTKDQLLNGQNFNPTSVNEQLSVFVLSYDSIRSAKKDGRKMYQENGNLALFEKHVVTPETLIDGIDNTALIQVINQLSPIIIVDESHNAETDLSVEMLTNLNPSFVLDLTATPRNNSNIISYVDAMQLKAENMVKLPVIVFNRQNTRDVMVDTIDLRKNLEVKAVQEQAHGGKYIRPIVLFQAQPKNKDDSETFEKVKAKLISYGINEKEIAIKTSNINELKNVDLLSETCEIRYIITVNALKEGWDCPFAYILASLANKSSRVDVEQILGRILRLPYTRQHKNQVLNMSYVLTSSNDFKETLENIVKALNKSGFSKNDFRAPEEIVVEETVPQNETTFEQIDLSTTKPIFENAAMEDFFSINDDEVKRKLQQRDNFGEIGVDQNPINDMFTFALAENNEFTQKIHELQNGDEIANVAEELRGKMNVFKMNAKYQQQAKNIKLPQFMIKTDICNLFSNGFVQLTKEQLSEGFILSDKQTDINFDVSEEVFKVDLEATNENESTPTYLKMNGNQYKYFKEYFEKQPEEKQINICKDMIYKQLNASDTINAKELKDYVDKVIGKLDRDQLQTLETSTKLYAEKIKEKTIQLQEKYLENQFYKMIDSREIYCLENYTFKSSISPVKNISSISKSLYESEGEINNFEHRVITEIASMDNIVWWHRNDSQTGFVINGFVNHYPDFILMTTKGEIVVIETKGDHLANSENLKKLRLGRKWQDMAGNGYSYFMVFDNKDLGEDGAYKFDEFKKIICKL